MFEGRVDGMIGLYGESQTMLSYLATVIRKYIFESFIPLISVVPLYQKSREFLKQSFSLARDGLVQRYSI